MEKITTKDQLRLKLLDYTDTERLERHVELEIAFATERKKTEALTLALSTQSKAMAGLRHELKQIVDAHNPVEKRG